ncbi:hypothetical protein N7461_007017 [Penicillium sp. DV-2018c]|nr:hypothetical protein N7461_007017 [Penicillium sp. DV-2018c]
MANTSDEEADSRTALVGAPRTRPNARSTSRSVSHDSTRPSKRQRRHRNKSEQDLADFVPRGGAFTAHSLPVDPNSTSSSGSSSSSNENSDSDENSDTDTAAANPHAGNTAPAISWNQGRKAAVRTSLGKRSVPTTENTAQFDAVNDKYWRSRSGSASSAEGEDKPSAKEPSQPPAEGEDKPSAKVPSQEDDLEEGEIDSRSESDDSDLSSEADDSILLNIGEKTGMDGANDYSPADLAQQHRIENNISQAPSSGLKEKAFRLFSSKYPSTPTALVDLIQEDLEIVAKYVYYDRNIHDLDLKLPITCIECHREGHLADVCPSKECAHCGAWNEHQSCVCPSWRRCPRCLERGHDEPDCTSKLREIPRDLPCGYCNLVGNHLESQCTYLWKFPVRDLPSDQITVSISCAECGSSKHLIGDCDKDNVAFQSSSTASFTLNGIDSNMITNLNTSTTTGPSYRGSFMPRGGRPGPGPRAQHRRFRSQSPDDDDDLMSRVSRGRGGGGPPRTNNTRGNIKFASGIGANRGRDNYSGSNNRTRSRSPPSSRASWSDNNNRNRNRSPPRRAGWNGNQYRNRSRSPPSRGGGRRGSQRGGFPRGSRGGGGGGGGGGGRGRGRGW